MSQTLHRILRRIRGGRDGAGAAARPAPAVRRVTTDLRKARHRFVPPSDTGLRWHGQWAAGYDAAMILKEPGAHTEWVGAVAVAVPVLICHPYSGILRIDAPGHAQVTDGYALFPYDKAFPLVPTLRDGPLRISAIRRNPLSRGEEAVVAGLWLPYGAVTETPADDPAAFEELQAQMVDKQMDNIRRCGGSVEEVTRKRQTAYLHCWRETLPYAPPGSRVLDLGAGFLYDASFAFFRDSGFDYTAIDIDRNAVAGNRATGAPFGFGPERFLQGRNTQLDVADDSADLPQTFAELRRVLRPGGHIFFAVPTTVDASEEHTYFFSHADWVAFTEEQGFEVVNQHIGNTYPETGHDILIVARIRG